MTTILVGIFFGIIYGGIYGAIFGGLLGAWINRSVMHHHSARSGFRQQAGFKSEQIQTAFFDATFMMMGRLAKADGRVSECEIEAAYTIMEKLRLSSEQRRKAIRLFEKGKSKNADIERALKTFRQASGYNTLIPMFFEIQLQAAYADGDLTVAERSVFKHMCSCLGVSDMSFELLHKRFLAQRNFYQERGRYQGSYQRQDSYSEIMRAYDVLGVEKGATDAEVKQAYRKLMSQHHPDKLVAKGLPEEMMQVAKQKAQEIQGAHDKIREYRKNGR